MPRTLRGRGLCQAAAWTGVRASAPSIRPLARSSTRSPDPHFCTNVQPKQSLVREMHPQTGPLGLLAGAGSPKGRRTATALSLRAKEQEGPRQGLWRSARRRPAARRTGGGGGEFPNSTAMGAMATATLSMAVTHPQLALYHAPPASGHTTPVGPGAISAPLPDFL